MQKVKKADSNIFRCKFCDNGDIILPIAKLQYPALAEPRAYQGTGTPKYQAVFIFPENADLDGLSAAIGQKMAENRVRKQSFEIIRSDNDNSESGFGEGVRYVRASSNRPVPLYDSSKSIIDASIFYPGCIVRPRVNLYYSPAFKCVCLGLQAVQFIRDGQPLAVVGSGYADPDEFDELDGDESLDF